MDVLGLPQSFKPSGRLEAEETDWRPWPYCWVGLQYQGFFLRQNEELERRRCTLLKGKVSFFASLNKILELYLLAIFCKGRDLCKAMLNCKEL